MKNIPEIVNEIRPVLMVDFRQFYDDKPHWYQEMILDFREKAKDLEEHQKELQTKINYDPDETFLDMEFLNLPISREDEIYEDPGKEKNKTIRELCHRIVKLMKEGYPIVLICSDGHSVSRYIAALCEWWSKGDFTTSKDIVTDILRARGDYLTAKSPKQQEQMKALQKEIALYHNGIRKFFPKNPEERGVFGKIN
jgi:hypothetical protein